MTESSTATETVQRFVSTRLLDLFCCAGGAGEGYRRAGFDVTGVDIEPQPNNPHRFITKQPADAGCAPSAGSVKSRYWRVTRRPENQRQFPGEYSTRHMLTVEATQEEAMDWAIGYFPTDTIVKVELWPGAPVSPNTADEPPARKDQHA